MTDRKSDVVRKRVLTASLALAALVGAGGTAHAQTAVPPSPQEFVNAAAQSDQYEMLAATAALAQSRNERVRGYAHAMIDEHQKLDAALRQASRAAGLPEPDPAMSADQARLLGGLQGLVAADFDRTYAGQQVLAHTQAAAVQGSFASAGAEPHLREAARSAVPMIQDHLTKARQLVEELGKP